MRTFITVIVFSLIALNLFGQARRPTIMVVPSDQYCISRGYKMEFESMGRTQTLPDYKAAMQNDADLRLVITKMGEIMADRGFPLKDLEMELRNMEREAAETAMIASSSGAQVAETPIDILKRTAQADIILDLSFDILKQGPHRYITFNLRGLDAYTSKQVSGAAGAGKPSSAASPELLLEEAVLSHMDGFNAGLMRHFDDMFANGREVSVMVRVWEDWYDGDLETYYYYDGVEMELLEHIEDWFFDNTVEGRFSLADASHTMMRLEQVRIPMMTVDRRGRERAVDTRGFVSDLRRHLRQNFDIDSRIYMRGLGEAWLIVGER